MITAHTDRQTQATTIPEGQNWPRVKTSKLRVTGLCARNSPGTGEFPAQMASNTEMFPFDDLIMRNIIGSYLYANVAVQVTKSDLNKTFKMAATIMT